MEGEGRPLTQISGQRLVYTTPPPSIPAYVADFFHDVDDFLRCFYVVRCVFVVSVFNCHFSQLIRDER